MTTTETRLATLFRPPAVRLVVLTLAWCVHAPSALAQDVSVLAPAIVEGQGDCDRGYSTGGGLQVCPDTSYHTCRCHNVDNEGHILGVPKDVFTDASCEDVQTGVTDGRLSAAGYDVCIDLNDDTAPTGTTVAELCLDAAGLPPLSTPRTCDDGFEQTGEGFSCMAVLKPNGDVCVNAIVSIECCPE